MSAAQLKKGDAGKIEVTGALKFGLVSDLLRTSKSFFVGKAPLVFDLGGVEKTDSAGLALLVEWMVMAKKSGQEISFQRIPKQMLDIAKVSGLDEILPLA
jgi:phospholipid transport system transporter-binding protein